MNVEVSVRVTAGGVRVLVSVVVVAGGVSKITDTTVTVRTSYLVCVVLIVVVLQVVSETVIRGGTS